MAVTEARQPNCILGLCGTLGAGVRLLSHGISTRCAAWLCAKLWRHRLLICLVQLRAFNFHNHSIRGFVSGLLTREAQVSGNGCETVQCGKVRQGPNGSGSPLVPVGQARLCVFGATRTGAVSSPVACKWFDIAHGHGVDADGAASIRPTWLAEAKVSPSSLAGCCGSRVVRQSITSAAAASSVKVYPESTSGTAGLRLMVRTYICIFIGGGGE